MACFNCFRVINLTPAEKHHFFTNENRKIFPIHPTSNPLNFQVEHTMCRLFILSQQLKEPVSTISDCMGKWIITCSYIVKAIALYQPFKASKSSILACSLKGDSTASDSIRFRGESTSSTSV